MSDDTLTGAGLVEVLQHAYENSPEPDERDAMRAALRAAVEAAGVTAPVLNDAAHDLDDLAVDFFGVAALLRALAEVVEVGE